MLLKELFLREDDRSTAVFAFGRFNPPTIGHQKLINKVVSMTQQVNGKGFLFLSQKQNNKTDPLTFAEKLVGFDVESVPPKSKLPSAESILPTKLST